MKKIKKNILRKFLLPLTLSVNLDSVLLANARKSACIINFHGVRETSFNALNNRHMHVGEFEKMLVYLQKTYDIIPLKKLFHLHRENYKPKKKTIALTFDDGYLNNFEIALPVLKKLNIPATFYIITKSLVESNYLAWPDIIDVILKKHHQEIAIEGNSFKPPLFFNESLKLSLADYLKTLGAKTEPIVQQLYLTHQNYFSDNTIPNEVIKLIDLSTIQKYTNESLLDFGSHSHSHFNFEYLEDEQVENEFKSSKEILERVTGRSVISIAFPDGSYTPTTVEIARKCGYENIVAVEYRFGEKNENPNLLSRFTISNSTTFESNALRLAKDFDRFGLI